MKNPKKRNATTFRKGHVGYGRGIPRSAELRAKLSASHKGRTAATHEYIARNAANMRGKKRPHMSGPSHPNWKGGATPENMRIRQSMEYKQWRRAVFERDNYTCQRCGDRGTKIEANHIRSFAQHPDLRLEVTNGETLCITCHRKIPKPIMPRRCSPENRANISAAQKKRFASPEARKQMREAAQRLWADPAYREHMRVAHLGQKSWNKGIPMTPEAKAKMIAGKIGKPAWNKGVPQTPAQRAANSVSKRGRIPWNKGRAWRPTNTPRVKLLRLLCAILFHVRPIQSPLPL